MRRDSDGRGIEGTRPDGPRGGLEVQGVAAGNFKACGDEARSMMNGSARSWRSRSARLATILAWSLIAAGCASDPAAIEEKPEEPIVAARIDRAKIDRSASNASRPALPAHPTDPVDPAEPTDASATTSPSSTSIAANQRSLQGSGSESGSATEGGEGRRAGESERGGGDGSEGSSGEAAGSNGREAGSTPPSASSSTQPISASQVKATKAGASSGSGSNSGESGSGSGSPSGAAGPAGNEGPESESTSASGESAESASSASADAGGEGSGPASAVGSGQSGQSASGSGAPTEAGGAGAGGGIGEQGSVESASTDHVQPESGGGGTQGASNATPGTPPAWIEPTAMEGSESAQATGGAGRTGAGEARTEEQASASGGGGAASGGAGDGRTLAPTEPAAPASSLGVAQTSDATEQASSEDFLDAPLEVRDYPTPEMKAPAKQEAAAPEIDADPNAANAAVGDEVASEGPIDSSPSDEAPATPLIDAEASTDQPDGSIEARDREAPTATEASDLAARTDEAPGTGGVTPASQGTDPTQSDAARTGAAAVNDGASSSSDSATADASSSAMPAADQAADSIEAARSTGDAEESVGDRSDTTEPSLEASRRSRILIDLPQIDVEPIEARSLRERSEASIPDDPRWVLRGAWEQSNLRENGADFAPGGYDRNLVAIDPEEGVLRTYRVFGDGAYVAAGEYRVEIRPEGTLDLRPDPRRPHLFASEPFTIAGETVLPPTEPIERSRQWSLRDGVLEIEGRRFVRLAREEFESVARGGERELDGFAGGDWAIAPSPRGDDEAAPAVDFFGTSIVGRHICFVVDVSGSMAGPRLQAALAELSRSIQSLPQDRFFYVLFFSGSKLVLEDRWLRASPTSKRSFLAKLAGIEAQGGTEPASALDHAFTSLAPVPDEVHFMTDGLIPQDIPERLRALNGGRVRTVIHTYAFGERASETMLEAIASEHGGRYRFVPE